MSEENVSRNSVDSLLRRVEYWINETNYHCPQIIARDAEKLHDVLVLCRGALLVLKARINQKPDAKYPLAPVSSTLDRLLDSRFDLAAEAEADLGEIEHKGEKVIVKIKVVRGEGV